MKLYKLTDERGMTRGKTQWGRNVTHTATGSLDQGLCSDGFIHAYKHPLLASLCNPIHANFAKPQLWEAEGEILKTDGGLKVGCRSLTTVRKIALPRITRNQRLRFAILVARQLSLSVPEWDRWAAAWLSGKDRSTAAARAAADGIDCAVVADSVTAAVWAAVAVWSANSAAEWAAAAAAAAKVAKIDFIATAKQAIRDERRYAARRKGGAR